MGKAIIFDMDGTLFQTEKILEISLHSTFNDLRNKDLWKKETPIEKYRNIMGVPLPVVWETLLPHHNQNIREDANLIFHKQLIKSIKNGKGALYPNIEETFEKLSQYFQLYIASNGQKEYLKEIVKYYKMDRWIQQTYSIEEIQSGNKSDLVSKIKANHQITEGIVVGDRLSDIKAGKDNNFFTVGCRFDFSQESELKQADIIISDLSELLNYFQPERLSL
ncbi:NIF family HAD-type phosphatase [Priestia aryabhattai]